MTKRRKKTVYKKGSGPPPARSASTPELARELGLPWIDTTKKSCPSNDLPCGECGIVKPTKLCNVGVSVKVTSGIQRLCSTCQTA